MGVSLGRSNVAAGQHGIVPACGCLAAGDQIVVVVEFDVEESRLKPVKAGVDADFEVMVLALGAVVGDEPGSVGQVGVACHHGTAVAEGAEVLARKKAGASHVAEGACGALHSGALVHGTEALCVVLDEAQAVL